MSYHGKPFPPKKVGSHHSSNRIKSTHGKPFAPKGVGIHPPNNKIKAVFLSINGRLSPSAFVVSTVLIMFISSMSYFILLPMCLLLPHPIKGLVMVGYILMLAWSCVAITVKRLHDLDRSGWLFLLILIPLLNIFFFLYLVFAKGKQTPNRFGNPGAPAPLPLVVVCYPVFFLVMALNFLPFVTKMPGLNKIPGLRYLAPASYTENPQDVQQLVDSMPKIIRDQLSKESLAVVLANGQMVAAGGFIAEDRLLVRGDRFASAIQNELARQQKLEVKTTDKTAHITRLVVYDPSPMVQMAVFEIDNPIGKPGHLDEGNRKLLTDMGAFR